MANPHDLSAGLLRQRRNLMVSSLVLIFFYHSGAKLGMATLLGMQITFDNPNAVITFLWVFQVYYLFRYYQYFRQEPDLQIRKEFFDRLLGRTHQKIHALKNIAFPGLDDYAGNYDFRSMKSLSRWMRSVNAVARRNEIGEIERDEFVIDVRQFWLDGLLSAIHVVLNRSYITDYFLPFMLAFFAMAIGLAERA